MKKQTGFTLIELVMVIVILGVLAAVAMPKFVDLKGQAEIAAKAGLSGGLQSAHSVLVATRAAAGNTEIYPTVTELAAGLMPAGAAKTNGVDVTYNGTSLTIPTYKSGGCTTPTTTESDTVTCVGTAS